MSKATSNDTGSPPDVKVVGQDFTSNLQPLTLDRSWVDYPFDYMFLTGQYPPGTVSHAVISLEQGRDQ